MVVTAVRILFLIKLKWLKKKDFSFDYIIINDIYPGSSTYPKVVVREVLHPIELEFENVDF